MHKEAREELRLRFKLLVLELATHFGPTKTCRDFEVPSATFFEWKKAFKRDGVAGLKRKKPIAHNHPRKVSQDVVDKVLHIRRSYQLGPERIMWYLGGFVLILKGINLLIEANSLNPNLNWPWIAMIIGLFIGILKAMFLFNKSCEKNLNRIDSLTQPRVWQFYRPGFFMALTAMILIGIMLSYFAHGTYSFLLIVAIIDISIAVALLGSSYVFWKK